MYGHILCKKIWYPTQNTPCKKGPSSIGPSKLWYGMGQVPFAYVGYDIQMDQVLVILQNLVLLGANAPWNLQELLARTDDAWHRERGSQMFLLMAPLWDPKFPVAPQPRLHQYKTVYAFWAKIIVYERKLVRWMFHTEIRHQFSDIGTNVFWQFEA